MFNIAFGSQELPIQEASQEHFYEKFEVESLTDRTCFRKSSFFYKIINDLSPCYLTDYLVNSSNISHQKSASKQGIAWTNQFRRFFYPQRVTKLHKLNCFKSKLLEFHRLGLTSLVSKTVTPIRLWFSNRNGSARQLLFLALPFSLALSNEI